MIKKRLSKDSLFFVFIERIEPVRGAGFAADRCRWQMQGGGKGEKQGVCRLSETRESRRLCFEVGLRRFKSRTAQEGAASEAGFAEQSTDKSPQFQGISKDIPFFVERKTLISIKNV